MKSPLKSILLGVGLFLSAGWAGGAELSCRAVDERHYPPIRTFTLEAGAVTEVICIGMTCYTRAYVVEARSGESMELFFEDNQDRERIALDLGTRILRSWAQRKPRGGEPDSAKSRYSEYECQKAK